MELAPSLGLCRRIVDLVSTGRTLEENGLVAVEKIADVTSRLIVNRAALKTRPREVGRWVARSREVADAAQLRHGRQRSEEHTSELQSPMRTSYDVFCMKKH